MSVIRLAVTAVTVAVTVARHPMVRAGMKAAPHLMTPAARQVAADTTRSAAYGAGVLARRLLKGR